MTISSTTTQTLTPTNGTTTNFAFANKIFSAADLVVTLIDLSGNLYAFTPSGLNTFTNSTTGLSYTVFNIDIDAGCFIVFSAAPTNLWQLDMRTAIAELQSTSIKNQSFFLPELHEEFFDRITREIQDLRRLTYTFGIHGPDIETTPWAALPSAAARANTLLGFTAAGLPTIAPSLATVLTQAAFNIFLLASPPFVQTPQELAAGITPINLNVPSHATVGVILVDRYGNNTTPGTTAMDPAFNTAVKLAKAIGGVVQWGPVGPYLLTAPIDCTTPVGSTNLGFAIRGSGQLDAITPNAPFRPGVIFSHTGHGFDTTGNTGILFENGSYGASTGTIPKTSRC